MNAIVRAKAMSTARLNPELLRKLAKKTEKSAQYIREQISKRAGRLGISSVAAQIAWAKERGIGVTHALNKLPAEVREEVRGVHLSGVASARSRQTLGSTSRVRRKKSEIITGAAIDSLLQDEQLRDRCKDLLLAKKHFDRVFREATTVLDDRLKKKSGIKSMNPANLVSRVLNPDPQKAVIEVSTEKDEQEGFHSICKGVMLAFRNKAHHSLSDKFTREDALKVCGFIDTLLATIEKGGVHLDRA